MARDERGYKVCTSCGKDLPRNRNLWGMVWESDRNTGVCKPCLYSLRLSIGYYEKHPEDLKKDKPRSQK